MRRSPVANAGAPRRRSPRAPWPVRVHGGGVVGWSRAPALGSFGSRRRLAPANSLDSVAPATRAGLVAGAAPPEPSGSACIGVLREVILHVPVPPGSAAFPPELPGFFWLRLTGQRRATTKRARPAKTNPGLAGPPSVPASSAGRAAPSASLRGDERPNGVGPRLSQQSVRAFLVDARSDGRGLSRHRVRYNAGL